MTGAGIRADFQQLLGVVRGSREIFQFEMDRNGIGQRLFAARTLLENLVIDLGRFGNFPQELESHGFSK